MIAALLASTEEVEVQKARFKQIIHNGILYASMGETVSTVEVGISVS